MLTDQNHSYADPDVPVGRQMPRNAPVLIGSGSWLGTGTVVLPGTHIGRNVVVAAGSVVRGTLPDRCVAAGVPARVVREYAPGDGWWPPAQPLPLLDSQPSAQPLALLDSQPSAEVLALLDPRAPADPLGLLERVEGVTQPPDLPG